MALVTSDQVKVICPTTFDDATIDGFIATADLIVSENLSGQGLSTNRLTQIELYLAAHFLVVTQEKGGLKSRKIGDATDSYQGITGRGLMMTRFGQQAVDLDTSGVLKTIGSSTGTAQFTVVGKACH